MLKQNFKEYHRQTLRVGDVIELPPHKVVSFNMSLQLVEILFKDGTKINVPFSFPSLNISPYGVHGYMSPEHLPFAHVGHCTERKANLVTHRIGNETKHLLLDRNFDLNGTFGLAPVQRDGKEVKYYTSEKWSLKSIKAHLDTFKGQTINAKGSIYGLLDENSNKFHRGVLVSKINRERFVVFILFENEVVYPFSIILFI